MSIYKVTVEKHLFVRAENKEEAEQKVFDDDFIFCDERISEIKKSSTREAQHTFFE